MISSSCDAILPISSLQMFDVSHPSTHNYASNFDHANFVPPRYVSEYPSSRPIPTNKWWGNLIHQNPQCPSPPDIIEPIWTNPYAVRVVPERGLIVTYSADHRHVGPPSENEGAVKYYLHAFIEDIVLSAIDLPMGIEVQNWDDFGVQVQLGNETQYLMSYFLSGMAFVSTTYLGTTPQIETIHAIISINGKAPLVDIDSVYTVASDSKLVLEFNNGQHWVVYANQSIEFRFITNSRLIGTHVVDSATTVRVARIDPNYNAMDALDDYASCMVIGGRVDLINAKRYNLEWETIGDGPFLHYALEHHMASFAVPPPRPLPSRLTAESATRGRMYGIQGRVWEFIERDTVPIRFEPAQTIDANDVRQFKIDQQLRDEVAKDWDIRQDLSYYFTGKKMQMYGSLCLMAHDDVLTKDISMRQSCIEKYATLWDLFLTNHEWPHPLVYDEVYKGIVSSEGFHVKDIGADFGNTVYNDHHYHYGYMLVSAAILLHLHPKYPSRAALEARIDVLIRDVANPNREDPYFPTFRHFDWYLGHSYSHGVTPMGDGKDQESTSEDINFNYGLMLWGKVTSRPPVEALGELMLKVNTRAIQSYFLMQDDNPVHPRNFIKNKVTGIFFDNKITQISTNRSVF